MPAIVSLFGSYDNFRAYFAKRFGRDYMVRLVNNDTSTSEILKYNPSGITKLGLLLKRHEFYNYIFNSITLDLTFSIREYGGGSFLLSAFNSKGIRANVTCYIYKRNQSYDYDLFYTGKVDFNPESFINEPNRRTVVVTLKQEGSQSKFLANDNVKLDITKNVAIDGTTITDTGSTDVIFKKADIFYAAESVGGEFDCAKPVGFSGVYFVYYPGSPGGINTSGGKMNLATPTDGIIYTNTDSEAREVRFTSTGINYLIESRAISPAFVAVNLYVRIYDSADNQLLSLNPFSYVNSGGGDEEVGGTVTGFDTGYYSIPAGGYIRYFVISQITEDDVSLTTCDIGGLTEYQILERSPSIGDTTVKCYTVVNAFTKLMRLITGSNTIFYKATTSGEHFQKDVITSGFLLRGYPDKGIYVSFRDLFKHVSSISPICLTYNVSTDVFSIETIDTAYEDALNVDFGEADNLTIKPSNHYGNEILAGSASTGDYEKEQGAIEFNTQHTYLTSFELKNTIDLRGPLNMDTIAMELTRREQYDETALTDTRFDDTTFYVRTNGVAPYQTTQGDSSITGSYGIEQYYNGTYNAWLSLINNGKILAGLFYKDAAGTAIRFNNNSKDIDISFSFGAETKTLRSNITKANLGTPLYYPENIECEVSLAGIDLTTFLSKIHRYNKVKDSNRTVSNIYIDSLETTDYERKAKLICKLANINRT